MNKVLTPGFPPAKLTLQANTGITTLTVVLRKTTAGEFVCALKSIYTPRQKMMTKMI